MLFWTILAAMTALAALAVLWPLSRAPRLLAAESEAGIAVYRDQLAEIDRDRARGVLAASEAEATRTEIARRLLAAARAENVALEPPEASVIRRRVAALAGLIAIPALALSIYLNYGTPGLPDAPLGPRLALPLEQQDIGMLIGRLEARLAQEPDNGRGWEIIAPIYLRVGRIDDAVTARESAIRILGGNAERETALGETYAAGAGGKITSQARAAFERALSHDADFPRALYYLGVAAEQGGNLNEARSRWARIIERAPAKDLWRMPAERALNRTRGSQ